MTKNDRNRQLSLRKLLQAAPHGALQAVANALGIKRQTLQKMRDGERPLSQAKYDRCCEALANFDRSRVASIGANYIKRYHLAPAVVYPPIGADGAFVTVSTQNFLRDALREFLMDKFRVADDSSDPYALLDYLRRA